MFSEEYFSPKPDLSSTRIMEEVAVGSDATTSSSLFEENATTAELRRQLFGASYAAQSADRTTRSEPDAVRSQERCGGGGLKKVASAGVLDSNNIHPMMDPAEITQEVFTEAFRQRLLSIRQREAELRHQAQELCRREQAIHDREQRQLRREIGAATSTSATKRPNSVCSSSSSATSSSASSTSSGSHRRRPTSVVSYDDASYLSIEPNDDTTILAPTVAKFDSNAIPRPKAFTSTLMRSSSSNVPPPLPARNKNHVNHHRAPLRPVSSGASYTHQDLAEAVTKALQAGDTRPKCSRMRKRLPLPPKFEEPLPAVAVAATTTTSSSCNDIPARWTDETKRTAFAMLAAMNSNNQRRPLHEMQPRSAGAAGADETIVDEVLVNDRVMRHDRKRQSMMVVMLRPGEENNAVPMTRL